MVPLEELQPNPKNPRDNVKAIEPVAEAIRKWGFGAPIVARSANGMIIAGHTRYEAAVRLGLKEVPVRFRNVTAAQAMLMGAADNKLGEIAMWDRDPLRELLRGATMEDAATAGWEEDELLLLLEGAPPGNPSGPDDATKHVQFKFGDHAGLVRRSVYDAFAKLVKKRQGADGTALLDDILGQVFKA